MIETGQNANMKKIAPRTSLSDMKIDRRILANVLQSQSPLASLKGPVCRTAMLTAAGIVDGTIKTNDENLRIAASSLIGGSVGGSGRIPFSEIHAAARQVAERRGITNPLMPGPLFAPGELSAAMERARVGYENQLVASFRKPLQQLVPNASGPSECVFAAIGSNRETGKGD